jgi:hypothetical protein
MLLLIPYSVSALGFYLETALLPPRGFMEKIGVLLCSQNQPLAQLILALYTKARQLPPETSLYYQCYHILIFFN